MSPNANASVAYGHIATATPAVEKVEEEQRLASHTVHQPVVAERQSPRSAEAKVREYFSDIPVMVDIAFCESTFRHQQADGTVLRGHVDGADTGVMQINTRYHQRTADALGLNLENIYDNMAYARHLYERQGTQPWNASAPCWNNRVAANR